jgi:hypothetical protein
LRGGSPKDALNVAALTIDLSMAAGERETSATVIDFNVRAVTSLGRCGIRHQQHHAACSQKPGNNGRGKRPMPCPSSQLNHSCVRLCATSFSCAVLYLGLYSLLFDARSNRIDLGNTIPNAAKARGIPLGKEVMQTCDFYGGSRFCIRRSTLADRDHPVRNRRPTPTPLQMGFLSHVS